MCNDCKLICCFGRRRNNTEHLNNEKEQSVSTKRNDDVSMQIEHLVPFGSYMSAESPTYYDMLISDTPPKEEFRQNNNC